MPVISMTYAAEPTAPDVLTVRPRPDGQLAITLADGRAGTFDVRPLLAWPAYAQLAQPGYFARAFVAYGTVCWPDGEDLAPETVAARLAAG
jgi:hypothetical protein